MIILHFPNFTKFTAKTLILGCNAWIKKKAELLYAEHCNHGQNCNLFFFVIGLQYGMANNQERERQADELICVYVNPDFSCVLYALRRSNSKRSVRTLHLTLSGHTLHPLYLAALNL